MSSVDKSILIIMERGGYPNFSSIFNQAGYQVTIESTMRKAMSHLKKNTPTIVIAEFNFQTDFRDRSSSLESLMATLQRFPAVKVIVFYEKEHETHFNRLKERYDFHCSLNFPISESKLEECILNVKV
jgi:DNA-binding NtrC family response regulator